MCIVGSKQCKKDGDMFMEKFYLKNFKQFALKHRFMYCIPEARKMLRLTDRYKILMNNQVFIVGCNVEIYSIVYCRYCLSFVGTTEIFVYNTNY